MALKDNPSGPRTPAWVLIGEAPSDRHAPRPSLDPDRWRKRWWRLWISVAIVVAALMATSLAVRIAHPRDEAAFLRQVDQPGQSVKEFPATSSLGDDDLVREGVYACQWLERRDRAFLRHGGRWDRSALLWEYGRETRPYWPGHWGSPATWINTRQAVADAAWSELCGGTWWWHRPHAGGGQLFDGGGGDD